MKIVLIYRNRVEGANSIEELFDTLAEELKKKFTVIKYQMGTLANLPRDILYLRKLKPDIYHITGDVHYVACFLPKRKTMLTIHDIHYYNYTMRGLKKLIYKWLYLTLPLRSISCLSTISAATKQVLDQQFNVRIPVHVINNCYNKTLFVAKAKEFSSIEPVILHLGTKANKNLPNLIAALKGLQCRLVIIGRLNEEQLKLLADSQINYTNQLNLTLLEIYNNYVQADLVAFASLSEGFGLPIIEAQAVGRPVITSNFAPMCDVAGNAACLIDPYSVDDIRSGIVKIILDKNYREQLIENGFENVQRYSPHSTAEHYAELYLGMLE